MDKFRLRATLAMASCCALASCAGSNGRGADAASGPPRAGRTAPDWNEAIVPGGTLSQHALRGKVVYLNFFATWCPPCNQEARQIEALQRLYGPKGLQVVGIDVLEDGRKAEAFRQSHALSYPVVVDDGRLRDRYGINGLPVHVFIDRRGVIHRVIVGELSAQQMRDNVTSLL